MIFQSLTLKLMRYDPNSIAATYLSHHIRKVPLMQCWQCNKNKCYVKDECNSYGGSFRKSGGGDGPFVSYVTKSGSVRRGLKIVVKAQYLFYCKR